MDVAETTALLGNLQNVEDWEKAFCDQVTGSGLFPTVKGCRILTADSMETAATTTGTAQVKVQDEVQDEDEDESPSADDNYGRKKKPGKNMGKLMETRTTVFIAMDEDSEGPDSITEAFLQDDLVFAFNKAQKEGTDLVAVTSHFNGKVKASEDPGGDLLFPELSKSLRGSDVGNWYYQG
jgi:uncharacterized protein Veg